MLGKRFDKLKQLDPNCPFANIQEEILNLCSNLETLQINNLMFVREQTYTASDLNNYEIDLVNSQLLATNITPPYTPNGTEVEYAELFSGQDFTQSEINDMTSNDSDKLDYSDNIRLSNPSKRCIKSSIVME